MFKYAVKKWKGHLPSYLGNESLYQKTAKSVPPIIYHAESNCALKKWKGRLPSYLCNKGTSATTLAPPHQHHHHHTSATTTISITTTTTTLPPPPPPQLFCHHHDHHHQHGRQPFHFWVRSWTRNGKLGGYAFYGFLIWAFVTDIQWKTTFQFFECVVGLGMVN